MRVVGLYKFAHWPACILSLLVLIAAACSTGGGLQIISHELTTRQFTGDLNSTMGMAVVTGIAKNIDTVPITRCNITVRYFDADKNIVGVSSAQKQFLEPAEVWSFTVQLTSPDAWKARSYDISSTNQ
jgi:hypothetical protein